MNTVVAESGELVVPREVVAELGVRPGATVAISVERGRLMIRRVPSREEFDSVCGIVKTGTTTDEVMRELRGRE